MQLTTLSALLLAALGAPALVGGELPRAYFGATQVGSWAQYETRTSAGGVTRATYTRLTDASGGFVVEVATEFVDGPGAGGSATSIFTLEPGFDWQHRFLSFGKALAGTTFVMEGAPPSPQAPAMVATMRESMADFGGGFDAAGSATHAGVECDAYSFRAILAGANPGTMTGTTCLSDRVPFGLVHQDARSSHEKSGESSFVTVLVDSGAGAARSIPAPEAKRMDLALAYQRGAIALDFAVPAGGNGRTLEVTITNIGLPPLVVAVGTTTYAFEVGVPLGTFFFQPAAAREVELVSGESSAPFAATQSGDRGLAAGSFRLIMAQGVPKVAGKAMKVRSIR